MTRPDVFRTRVREGLAAHPVGHDYTPPAPPVVNRAVGERYLVDDEEGE